MNNITRHCSKARLPALMLGACLAGLPAMAEDCVVKIGTVGPMTGAAASWGQTEKAGVEFEARYTNEHGGLKMGDKMCKVEVVSYDAQSTAAGAAAAANYFASQGVHAVNGPVLSPENTGWKPVANRNNIVSFATSFAADVIGPDYPLNFHKTQSPPAWGPPVLQAVKDHYHLNSVLLIGPNDQGGTDAITALSKLYDAVGIKAFSEYYQRGTTNFSPIAVRIMAKHVDAVDMTTLPPGEGAILAKELREAGFDGAFGRLGAGGDVIIKGSGGVAGQRAFYTFDHIPTEDPGMKKLHDEYVKMFGKEVPDNTLFYNAEIAAEVLLKAVSVAGTDQDGQKIAVALRGLTPESRYIGKHGWRGMAQYGINQELSFPVGMNFITNGKEEPQMRVELPTE